MAEIIEKPANTVEEGISIMELLSMCLRKWYWFVVSVALFVAGGYLYIKMTPRTYERHASIMIKDETKGGSIGAVSELENLGLTQSNTNVNNEMVFLQSPTLMFEVVKRLGLDTGYSTEGTFHDIELYGQSLPARVRWCEGGQPGTGFRMRLLEDRVVVLSDFSDGHTETEMTVSGRLMDTLSTPAGKVVIEPTLSYTGQYSSEIAVSKLQAQGLSEIYAKALSLRLKGEKSTIIEMSLIDQVPQRAEDILNTLITVYNENWIKDKNQIAVSTSNFISSRLAVIEKELGNVDEDISSFKSKNLVPDLQAASSMYLSQSSEATAKLQQLNNILYMTDYIRSYMTDGQSLNQLLPANSGIESASIESQISEFNTLQLQRNSLVANSNEQNPLVVDMDRKLSALREAIISSIDTYRFTLKAQIKSLEAVEQQATSQIAANPSQAKYLLSVERQQKVKEALYLFLLQKREENEISQAFTAYNTRIVQPASGSMIPVAPVSKTILLLAFMIGLIIPAGIIFLLVMLNHKVKSKKDLESLTIPFIGEIPLSYKRNRHFIMRWKKDGSGKREMVVQEHNRNVINEAFRVVRTNFEFIMGSDQSRKTVMFTSMDQGSGKTFISMNLAMAFAIKGKRTVVVDLDMRKAALSEFLSSPKRGVSDYLNGRVSDFHDTILRGQFSPSLDFIPVGTLPPNPAELLFDSRLERMLNTLRSEYDYVFIDCPPMEIVADSSIIAKYADMTVFVVRAELMDKSLLPVVESYYTDRKFHSMAVILNGTEVYGGYGYSRYASYGYSYGYGKGSIES